MLHDLDRTLQKLLYERGNLKKDEIEIAFEQPTAEWSSRLSRPTINCWCFDLRENIKLRNMEMQRPDRDILRQMSQRDANGKAPQIAMQLAPLRFNLTYLVTAWARKIEDEHRLLWRALGALTAQTMLEPAACEGELKDQPYDIPISAAQITEAASTFTDLWSVLDNQMRLGFTLQVTLALDTQRAFEAPLVLESVVRVGQSLMDEIQSPLEPDGRDVAIDRKGESYKKREDWEK